MIPDQTAEKATPDSLHYLFAGDICYQSMRVEEKSEFPVHRYGFSFDVHRHKAINGTTVLKYLVEQCFEHELLDQESDETNPADSTIHEKIEGVKAWLGANQVRRLKKVQAVIWNSANEPLYSDAEREKPLIEADKKKTLYHESVVILRETKLQDQKAGDDAKLLNGFRIDATHTVSDSDSQAPEIHKDIYGAPLSGSDLVLNLDMEKFGFHGEFANLKKHAPFGNLVVRLRVPRKASYQPSSKSESEKFSDGLLDFLHAYNIDRVKKSPITTGTSVLVMSSESLRNAGFEISYRVAWERSITGVFKALGGKYIGNKEKILQIIKAFDYLIINFYNDGGLLITNNGQSCDKAVFAAIPSQTEGDHSARFTGVMKGTETMITASVAYHLRSSKAKWGEGDEIPKRLQMAMVHGLKASRYVQSHGNSTLHQSSQSVLSGELPSDYQEDDKFKAVKSMIDKLKNSQNDVLRYLWNRTRSTEFANRAFIPAPEEHFKDSKKANSRICAMPMGDVVEILGGGYPMFGSFPPVALTLYQGRDAVEKETRKVLAAWNDSGWIEVGEVSAKRALGEMNQNTGQTRLTTPAEFHHFWSLRTSAVAHLAAALQAGTTLRTGKNEYHHLTVARFLLAEMMIRFGTKHLNRSTMTVGKHFDIVLIERILLFCESEIPIPAFYGDYFVNFDKNKFMQQLTGEIVDMTKYAKIIDAFREHDWLKLPVSGSTLGMFPGFAIKKLFTIDRRDTQSYRDIRERLIGFQESDAHKPLNLLVVGGPGSGKSFAVKEILSGVYEGKKEIAFLEYNLASFAQDASAITSAFLEIQNVSLQDKLPVVFWDEYDTSVEGTKLAWLPTFLGPMQDGKFFMGQSSRYLPKCVFIFAGSVFSRFDQIRLLDRLLDTDIIKLSKEFEFCSGAKLADKQSTTIAQSIQPNQSEKQLLVAVKGKTEVFVKLPCTKDDWLKAKGRDFKSRITGMVDIGTVDWPTQDEIVFGLREDDDAWFFRRAAAVRNCFEMQAKHLLNKDDELQISNETLFAFLTVDNFDHGYRSIESLVRMSSLHGRAIADGSVVPSESQVRAHSQTDFFHPKDEKTYIEIAQKFEEAYTAVDNLK